MCVSVCVLSASVQAHIHMGACVSDTSLPVKLVRRLMIVTQPPEENSIWFLFFISPFYVETATLIVPDLLNIALDVKYLAQLPPTEEITYPNKCDKSQFKCMHACT